MHIPENVAEALGWLTYEFSRVQPLLPTYVHLILSALFPIFAGAHASLSRPSSAAKPAKRKTKDGRSIKHAETQQQMEGLTASDAIMFPLAAGATLTSLYFIIKWLEDPNLLNKILNGYFATFSIYAVATLVSDGLGVFHSVLFPRQYIFRGLIWTVKPATRTSEAQGPAGVQSTASPLPGSFSHLPLPKWMNSFAWFLYVVPHQKLTLVIRGHGLGRSDYKVGVHGIEGAIVALAAVAYYNFVDKPWWLTNVLGFGFAYGAVQLMSPTTFSTGTLLLSALFFYDIYFVFFTPMMVTVAQSLDVPIKLLFPRPSEPEDAKPAMSMLGLGDVVLPGLMIGLALRFDLYMHYLRQQRLVTSETGNDLLEEKNDKQNAEFSDNDSATTSETKGKLVKAPFMPIVEPWGPLLWTSPLARLLDPSSLLAPRQLIASSPSSRTAFTKPYFYAGITGYIAGLLATLAAMHVSKHPQPALLYLVPAVVGSLWLLGLLRGEIRHMYEFSDAFEDEEDKPSSRDEETKSSKQEKNSVKREKDQSSDKQSSSPSKSALSKSTSESAAASPSKPADKQEIKTATNTGPARLLELMLLAPSAPVYDAHGELVADGQVEDAEVAGEEQPQWVDNSNDDGKSRTTGSASTAAGTAAGSEGKHVDKRLRVR